MTFDFAIGPLAFLLGFGIGAAFGFIAAYDALHRKNRRDLE